MLEIIQGYVSTHSTTINIILTLLLLFQWYKQQSREDSIKNNIFAIRRNLCESHDTHATVEMIDATLATLGVRKSYVEAFNQLRVMIRDKFRAEQARPVENILELRSCMKKTCIDYNVLYSTPLTHHIILQ